MIDPAHSREQLAASDPILDALDNLGYVPIHRTELRDLGRRLHELAAEVEWFARGA